MSGSHDARRRSKPLSHDFDPFSNKPLFSNDGVPLDSDGNKIQHLESKFARERSRSRNWQDKRSNETKIKPSGGRRYDHTVDFDALLDAYDDRGMPRIPASRARDKEYERTPNLDTSDRYPASDAETRRPTYLSDATTLNEVDPSFPYYKHPRQRRQAELFKEDYLVRRVEALHDNQLSSSIQEHPRRGRPSEPYKDNSTIRRYETASHKGVDRSISLLFGEQLEQRGTEAHRQPAVSERTFLYIPFDVAAFVTAELAAPHDLWNLIVLSGDEDTLWAGSVGEYISARWPSSLDRIRRVILTLAGSEQYLSLGEEDLDLLSAPLESDDDEPDVDVPQSDHREVIESLYTGDHRSAGHSFWTVKGETRDDLTVSLISTNDQFADNNVSLSMVGEAAHRAELIEALAWLFAVLHNGQGGPFPCTVSLQVRRMNADQAVYAIESVCHPDIASDKPGTCWLSLLPHTACAANFTTPFWRPQSRRLHGIELTFDLLCVLCGICYETEHDGGLVMYGDKALVYPVFMHENCVQWHFQPCEPGDNPHVEVKGERLCGKDLDELRASARHFLGLWSDPEITLGTESSEYHKIKYSRAEILTSTRVKDTITVGGSIHLPRVLTLTSSVTYKVAKTRITHHIKGPVTDQLHSKITSPVLLYCPSEKRAWLVSYVSVVLHLARCRALLRAELNYHMPACERRADGGRAAWECIRACHTDCLKQAEENEVLTDYEKTVKIADHVEEVMACVERTRRESNLAKGFFRDRIVGYELADIAKYKDSTIMKKCKLEALTDGWGPLLETVELVFFYEGLPDPIVPSSTSKNVWRQTGPCGAAMWQEIPSGLNLLAASLPCLLYQAEKQGEKSDGTIRRLTPSYAWHCPTKGGLYGSCRGRSSCSCNHLQQLVPVSRQHTSSGIRFSGTNIGAVVFRYSDKTTMEHIRASLAKSTRRRSTSSLGHVRSDSGYSSEQVPRMNQTSPTSTLESVVIESDPESDTSSSIAEEIDDMSAVSNEAHSRSSKGNGMTNLDATTTPQLPQHPRVDPASVSPEPSTKPRVHHQRRRPRAVDTRASQSTESTHSVQRPSATRAQNQERQSRTTRRSPVADTESIPSSSRTKGSKKSSTLAQWFAGAPRK